MEPTEQTSPTRKRFTSPNLNITKIKHTDSIEGQHFDLVSPTVPVNFYHKFNTPKLTPPKPQQQTHSDQEISKIPEAQDITKKLNNSQRKMVSSLVKAFIAEQQQKPDKILVKINGIAVNNLNLPKSDQCRIDKIQICRYDPSSNSQDCSQETEQDQSVYSFAAIPEVSKVILTQPPSQRAAISSASKRGTLQKYSKVSVNLMKIQQTISISYKPKKELIEPEKESEVLQQQSLFSNLSKPSNNSSKLLTEDFMKLAIFVKKKELEENNDKNKRATLNITTEMYGKAKNQAKIIIKKINEELDKIKKELQGKSQELKRVEIAKKQLQKENQDLNRDIQELKGTKELLNKQITSLEEIIKAQKEFITKLKIEENGKNISETQKSQPTAKLEKNKEDLIESYCVPTLALTDKKFSIKVFPSEEFLQTNGLTVTERQTPLLRSVHQSRIDEPYFNPPKISTSRMSQQKVYSCISNPKVAEEVLRHQRNQALKRSSQATGIKRQQKTSAPSETSKILHTHRSSDNIRYRGGEDDSSDKLQKNSKLSGKSSSSRCLKLGYKTKESTAREGMLLDYMLSDSQAQPAPQIEEKISPRQSRFRNKDQTSSNGSDKKRFKYKTGQ